MVRVVALIGFPMAFQVCISVATNSDLAASDAGLFGGAL